MISGSVYAPEPEPGEPALALCRGIDLDQFPQLRSFLTFDPGEDNAIDYASVAAGKRLTIGPSTTPNDGHLIIVPNRLNDLGVNVFVPTGRDLLRECSPGGFTLFYLLDGEEATLEHAGQQYVVWADSPWSAGCHVPEERQRIKAKRRRA